MDHPPKTIPMIAVIAIAMLSGALASAVAERAAGAATVTQVQDPRLTRLLQYVTVDNSGNVTVKGNQIRIQGTNVLIRADASASLQSEATTAIKGTIVRIN